MKEMSDGLEKTNVMQENVTVSPEMMNIASDGVVSVDRDLFTVVSASHSSDEEDGWILNDLDRVLNVVASSSAS